MTKIRITILAQKQRSPCTTTISSSLSLSSSLLQLVLRHSWWFSLRMPFPLRVSRSPLVCHCFTVKLLNSFIGVSTLVTFLSERHGCVRGVSFMCRMCLVTFSLLFYRSFELIHRETDLFPLRSPARTTTPTVHLSAVVGVLPA